MRVHRKRRGAEGTALAVAMLVVVMLSGIGMVALNAASYDLASAGAVRQGVDAESVAEGGLILARTEMCRSLDAIVLAMSSMRSVAGRPPEFELRDSDLQAHIDGAGPIFAPPTAEDGRGSFGHLYSDTHPIQPPQIQVTIDRPRESEAIAGFSLREAAGSDSSSFCVRRYRVTSEGTYVPLAGTAFQTKSQQRAFIVAGPIECTM